ncbi:MAG: peptidase U32 family protein [Eisenbergiella sp.]
MDTATKKPELLAPAGDYSCFQAALKAGADAVYIGGQRFGARAFAGNFSDEEVVEAAGGIFYGRKLYLTKYAS